MALNRFHVTNSESDLQLYLDLRRHFKNVCKAKKREFDRVEAKNLLDNSLKPNSKSFWRQIKQLTTSKSEQFSNDISPSEWYDHFKRILNTNIENENEVDFENCTDSTITCPLATVAPSIQSNSLVIQCLFFHFFFVEIFFF